MVNVRDDEAPVEAGHAESQVALLPNRMVGICKGNREWVTEDGSCLMERNTVLPHIRASLIFVPLKYHHIWSGSIICRAPANVNLPFPP